MGFLGKTIGQIAHKATQGANKTPKATTARTVQGNVTVEYEGMSETIDLTELLLMVYYAGCKFTFKEVTPVDFVLTVFGPNEVLDFNITKVTQ